MNDRNTSPRECQNENCVRAAEPAERYCATCGLEISLYVRDLRPRRPGARAWRLPEERRA